MVCGQGGISGLHRGGRKFGGLDLQGQPDGFQREIFLKIHALKREQEHRRIYFTEGSILQPLRQGSSSTEQIQQSRESKNGLHLHPLKSIKNWRVK